VFQIWQLAMRSRTLYFIKERYAQLIEIRCT